MTENFSIQQTAAIKRSITSKPVLSALVASQPGSCGHTKHVHNYANCIRAHALTWAPQRLLRDPQQFGRRTGFFFGVRRGIKQWAFDEDNLFNPGNRLFAQEQVCALRFQLWQMSAARCGFDQQASRRCQGRGIGTSIAA